MRARTNRYIAKSRCQRCLLQSWCITATSINSYIVDRRVDLKHIPSSKKKNIQPKLPLKKDTLSNKRVMLRLEPIFH
uniref:CTP synthase family protein 2 n=1 Tax=Populus tomentosa TaxID=118781 RepID=A0A1L6K4L0_POPTO|nr:CTP synthase family protein 2 [Populus tomentosa]